MRAESSSVLVATILLVLVIGVLRPAFLTPGQLLDVLNNATYVALLAAGLAFQFVQLLQPIPLVLPGQPQGGWSPSPPHLISGLCRYVSMRPQGDTWSMAGIGRSAIAAPMCWPAEAGAISS